MDFLTKLFGGLGSAASSGMSGLGSALVSGAKGIGPLVRGGGQAIGNLGSSLSSSKVLGMPEDSLPTSTSSPP